MSKNHIDKYNQKCYNCNKDLKLRNNKCINCGIRYLDIRDYLKEPFILVSKIPVEVKGKYGKEKVDAIFNSKIVFNNSLIHPYGLEIDHSLDFSFLSLKEIKEGLLHFHILPVKKTDDEIIYTIQMEG